VRQQRLAKRGLRLGLVAAILCAAPLAEAQKKPPAPATPPTQVDAKGTKSKSYTFTGLDIDGKLKTPQLLYFLNRMKSEFDSTTPDKRSFLPELEASTSQM
jgi:hypothetical protein